MAWSTNVRKRAFKIALVVGSILAIINHVDAIFDATFSTRNAIQALLTYVVPYAVSTYSSVGAIRAEQAKVT